MNQNTPNYQINSHARVGFSYRKAYILLGVFSFCTLIYYFGELANIAGWKALQLSFFYSVHDIHRLLFIIPIIYAGYYLSRKAVIIITIITIAVFIPRALFISPYPDPVLRAETFAIIAGLVGYLIAILRAKNRHINNLETNIRYSHENLLDILEKMADGVLITGPDFKVRFTNQSMVEEFGEGIGTNCYQYLHQSDKPCPDCRLHEILNGAIGSWQYKYSNGNIYEVKSSSFADSDGVICQLASFRKITRRE